MARKKSTKTTLGTKSSFMFPQLHSSVFHAVSDEIPSPRFNNTDTDKGSHNEYSTFVMGKFQCYNNSCSNTGWSSKKVTILIRGYGNNLYNAVVFGQRCQSCNRLGNLTLDEASYVDRVAYRLKKWAGVATDDHIFSKKEGPPHKSELCEGCKRGYCQRRKDGEYWFV
ncbi:MAG: hypothetical protein Q9228_006264 [Teloschistes exilis]